MELNKSDNSGSEARSIGSNKPTKKKGTSTNPRKNIGDTTVCTGSTDELNSAWAKVKTETDVREFY